MCARTSLHKINWIITPFCIVYPLQKQWIIYWMRQSDLYMNTFRSNNNFVVFAFVCVMAHTKSQSHFVFETFFRSFVFSIHLLISIHFFKFLFCLLGLIVSYAISGWMFFFLFIFALNLYYHCPTRNNFYHIRIIHSWMNGFVKGVCVRFVICAKHSQKL